MKLYKDLRYLFVCTYGQSRSKYFAEETMKKGYMALFCGWYKEGADFVLNWKYVQWADVIVILDSDIKREEIWDELVEESMHTRLELIDFPLEDEPSQFRRLYRRLLKE